MPSEVHRTRGEITVLIADASLINGQLIAGALKRCRDKFKVLGSTCTSPDAVHLLEECAPHVAVISTELQDGPLTGFKVLHQVRASGCRTAVVMLMDSSDRELVVDSFRAGARGVFSRRSPLKSLSKCIRTVHGGQLWISSEQLEFLLDLITRLKPLQLPNPKDMRLLTKREAEVVDLVVQGMKNSEIAVELHLTEHTVRNYLFRVFEKLGLSSRVELVVRAVTQQEDDQADCEPELRRYSQWRAVRCGD